MAVSSQRNRDVDLAALLSYLHMLGATDDEIARASSVLGLGPLALDLAIRPEGAPETFTQFSQRTGIAEDVIRGHWIALGFPVDPPFPFPVTRDIAFAIEVMVLLEDALGGEAALDFAHVLGSTTARLADALAEMTRVGVELPQLASGARYSQVVEGYSKQARELLPTLLELIGAVFRRHLVLVSYQLWSPDEARTAVTLQRTVCFADMVGSTSAIREATPSEMARLVRSFERHVWDAVTSEGGRVVKLIGDEAMFVVDEPATAVRVVVRLLQESPHPLRAGLDHGPVVALGGDYYGRTVNLAARLVALAPAGTAVVSDAVRSAVPDAAFDPVALNVRDFPDVRTHTLRPR
jgi:class 3 adenylate cyclase